MRFYNRSANVNTTTPRFINFIWISVFRCFAADQVEERSNATDDGESLSNEAAIYVG